MMDGDEGFIYVHLRDHETFNRLAGDESVHNLRDIRAANAPVKK